MKSTKSIAIYLASKHLKSHQLIMEPEGLKGNYLEVRWPDNAWVRSIFLLQSGASVLGKTSQKLSGFW